MKRFISLILALAMLMTLCACESKEERALREATEAAEKSRERYNEAKAEYDYVVGEVDRINKMAEALGVD